MSGMGSDRLIHIWANWSISALSSGWIIEFALIRQSKALSRYSRLDKRIVVVPALNLTLRMQKRDELLKFEFFDMGPTPVDIHRPNRDGGTSCRCPWTHPEQPEPS